VVHSSDQVAANTEEILDGAVHREKLLRVRGRFEPAHLALALPGRLVRDLGAIIRVLVCDVDDGRHHSPVRR
jgi:hypothetical protein|tara:strand:- start:345 stop:560 length:216 start_codon:yes stop_codon:yes gene_type:complete